MEVPEPISTPDSDQRQPLTHGSQSPLPDQLGDDPKSPPPAPLTEEFQAILNLKEDAAPDAGEDSDGGHVNGVSEQEEEDDVGGVGESQNETGKDGEMEKAENGEQEEEIVKDGWSDDQCVRVDGDREEDDSGDGYQVDGWSNGNGVGETESKEEVQGRDMQLQYPLRPGAEDCNYYMRMGSCKYGLSCKFNHPPRRRNLTLKPRMKEREDNSERPMQVECKYYLSAGGCKYGKACRFSHSRERPTVVPVSEYNFLGLPIRPGEKECPYYMRNGSCKYAATCRFNHPDPTAGSNSPSGYANDEQASPWSPSMPSNEAVPFVPASYTSAQGVHSHIYEWKGYQGPAFTAEKSFRPSPAFGLSIPPMERSAYSDFQPQLTSEEFPERPGQPECTFFLKTGDCKFRSRCKFHHPKDQTVQLSCAMTDKGLPLRPGQSICAHYSNYGICKFGPKCRYDHPPDIQHTPPPAMTGLGHPRNPFSNFTSPEDTSRLSSIGEGTITL
uniref:C3H1-type domain-containing protein n=1 Tax=Kalanchoe fedtschenkoi TaxID=63787 RepID=A0A7N0UXD9_KALFE